MPRVVTHPEGQTRPSVLARMGRSAGVLRPWPAGREASKHVGAPRRSCTGQRGLMVDSSGGTAGATRRRHHAGTDAPCRIAGAGGGAVLATGTPAICGWGVVSSVVLGGGESLRQGEGLDGSPPPGKATHPGQVGPEQHAPTSLRARANKARAGNGSAWRGSECNRGTGGGENARPGLHGGRRVTGVPTVAAADVCEKTSGQPPRRNT